MQYWSVRDGFLRRAGAVSGHQAGTAVPSGRADELSVDGSSARRASALGPGALKFGLGCRGYGYKTHTNTDNVPPVRQWAGW